MRTIPQDVSIIHLNLLKSSFLTHAKIPLMTQSQALDILKTGGNVFLTGEPGAGKTFVLNQYLQWLEAAGVHVAVTASTGIAATHIGGMTIHSWSGIGARDEISAYDLDQIVTKEKTVKRIKKAQVLVIDEICMHKNHTLDSIGLVCRTIRQSSEPFGGLQVIFVGDFFQLPPIAQQGEVVRYAYESRAWAHAQPLICYLTEQYRQEDEMFLNLLRSIRKNQIEDDHYTLLQEQTEIGYEGIEPTRLYTHNADVDAVNLNKLKSLTGKGKTFKMSAVGNKQLLLGLVKSCLSPEVLELREEAMVMFTKNNFEVGYVNGTLGRVLRFDSDGLPVVETTDGLEVSVKPTTWDLVEDKKVLASLEQIPLRLAWAITVHKSQGMSLDAAEIDLSKAFVSGQGYVALSRVRSLEGVKILGMHPNALQVDPRVSEQDERFYAASAAAEREFVKMEEDEIEAMHKAFVLAMGGKLPSEAEVAEAGKTKPVERVKKESTYAITAGLIREGKSVKEIAKERKVAETTIWGHVEKLLEEGELKKEEAISLVPKDEDWEKTYTRLAKAMDKVGTEKLKPIFEECNEEIDYGAIRVGRILYLLEGK